jgi:hypothetical protein
MAALYKLRNVNDVARHVIRGITAALDKIAPLEAIGTCPGGNLYLSLETRRLMSARDSAKGIAYKHLRNRVSSLVK